MSLARGLTAEAVATALLLAAVVGSGIMGERLSGGSVALALLANTLATGSVLVALLLAFGPISGAHLNPVVTLTDAWTGSLGWHEAFGYVAAQTAGAAAGVMVANLMFGEPLLALSEHGRHGGAQLLSEFVATFGLLSVVSSCSRLRPTATPFAVGAYITAAYWFTASTSFANPAVTVARALTDTFAGIQPSDVPGFVGAQLLAGATAAVVWSWLLPRAAVAAPVATTMAPAPAYPP